jgi:hypothetical protein
LKKKIETMKTWIFIQELASPNGVELGDDMSGRDSTFPSSAGGAFAGPPSNRIQADWADDGSSSFSQPSGEPDSEAPWQMPTANPLHYSRLSFQANNRYEWQIPMNYLGNNFLQDNPMTDNFWASDSQYGTDTGNMAIPDYSHDTQLTFPATMNEPANLNFNPNTNTFQDQREFTEPQFLGDDTENFYTFGL